MIQKVLRCTLGIFSGNIYLDIANKPDRRVWLVCCSTEWGREGKVLRSITSKLGAFLFDSSLFCYHSACISSTSGR